MMVQLLRFRAERRCAQPGADETEKEHAEQLAQAVVAAEDAKVPAAHAEQAVRLGAGP